MDNKEFNFHANVDAIAGATIIGFERAGDGNRLVFVISTIVSIFGRVVQLAMRKRGRAMALMVADKLKDGIIQGMEQSIKAVIVDEAEGIHEFEIKDRKGGDK